MQAMVERNAKYTLCGNVQADDAYLGGELAGGKAGRPGLRKQGAFCGGHLAQCEGRPLYIKIALVRGFTRKAVFDWAAVDLAPGFIVTSDGLGCFAGVTDAGCQHRAIVANGRKPKDLPELNWINAVLGNLKTNLGGAYHAFDFAKYGTRHLGAFVYRVSTGASILRGSLYACPSLQPLSGHAFWSITVFSDSFSRTTVA